jgi:hypothetical protein
LNCHRLRRDGCHARENHGSQANPSRPHSDVPALLFEFGSDMLGVLLMALEDLQAGL